MPYSASQRGACKEDQAENCQIVKLCSYLIAQEQMKQRLCKVICEKQEGERGKKAEQVQGPRDHGNKVLRLKARLYQ